MIVKYGKTSKAQRKRNLEAIGIIGVCFSCGDHVDGMGFKCACKMVECVGCWFKRTGGHKNSMSPEWHCKKCGMVTIYDRDMVFIKRWSKEQWERWNAIGESIKQDEGS